MKKIIIAGGSGFLGSALETHFTQLGFQVKILTRSPERVNEVQWDGKTLGNWTQELEGCKALINLTGKSINSRLTDKNKKLILDSRVDSTRILGKAINTCQTPPKVWLNASGAAIYPSTIDESTDEYSPETEQGFLEDVVRAWEKAFNDSVNPSTRKVMMRITIVLGKDGGALAALKKLTQFGLGGKQGSGNQMISWVHLDDFVRMVQFLIENESLKGHFNICTPEPVSNKKFMAALRNALRVPIGIPQPEFLLKLGGSIIGIDTDLILKSRNTVPKRLMENNFEFKFPCIDRALMDIFD